MTDQKRIGVWILLFFLFGVFQVYASVTTDTIAVFLTPSITTKIVQFENTNLSESQTLSLSLSTSLVSAVSISSNSIQVPHYGSVTLSIKSNATSGSHTGSLDYTYIGGSGSIPVSAYVEEEEIYESDLMIFPTSKIINVQQGTEKTQNILVTVPLNYGKIVNIQSVDFNPGTDTIRFGDLNLGQVQPGNSVSIPIVFSGVDAQTGSYQTDLNIFATDEDGQIKLPKISLTLYVTAGVSPVTEDTFSSPPTCTLSSTTINLNQTYSFTCNSVNNINVEPDYNEYLIGKSVDVTTGVYKYEFQAIKYGTTMFQAIFKYKGSPVFGAFSQELRITSAGGQVPGTDLKFLFTPSLESLGENESVIIQIIDNKTGSLVLNPRLWINAREVIGEGETFEFSFEAEKDYELRGKSEGYEDLLKIIKISPKTIKLLISPERGTSETMFNITANSTEIKFYLNDVEIANPFYGQIPVGVNVFTAKGSGYKEEKINITVEDIIRIINGPIEFKKGKEQVIFLSQNMSYTITYQKKLGEQKKDFYSGNGDRVVFTPDKAGIYNVESEGRVLGSYEAKGFSLTKKYFGIQSWLWLIILILVVFLIIVISKKGGTGDKESNIGFRSRVNVD